MPANLRVAVNEVPMVLLILQMLIWILDIEWMIVQGVHSNH